MARANTQEALRAGDARTDLSKDAIKKAFIDNLFFVRAKFPEVATKQDLYVALAYTIRDRILNRWIQTAKTYLADQSRTVVYLSAEFLLGPHLGNNTISLRCLDAAREAVNELGYDLDDLLDQEEEPGLGNGGLGRLAACYLDSMAHLGLPAIGYGIRYEFGIFDQEIRDGWQIEITDKWLRYGNPWEIVNPEITHPVKLGGRTESYKDADGKYRVKWIPSRDLVGVAHDTPIAGYGVENTNFLRLWKAEATEHFDFQAFNIGDYYRAVNDKVVSENITKVLYPNDVPSVGKELRLQQQYFFVTCSLQDMIRIYKMREKDLRKLHEKFVVQLNDTHPAIGVAELMRLLVDEHGLGWEDAWECTRKTFAYTNHTLLPEALECWPVELFKRVLPRHWEIVLEINARFLAEVRKKFPNDDRLVQSLSIIDEHGERYVRMANLAAVGSRAINGVAALHTELLKADVMKDFNRIEPKKFNNKTNGVTPRRFLLLANPRLAALITSKIGDGWVGDLSQLKGLEKFADDAKFQEDWRAVKLAAKTDLAKLLQQRAGVTVDPKSVFDILVKRIHEYKRQHLDVLGVIHRYLRILRGEALDAPPRTFIFAGKAAPGYTMAKRIIKLVHCVASVVNNDPKVGGRLKVAFFPDFNVKNAQHIYPACDVSEQISTAGKEASGTGCMKFMINGALTIGTLDGANVEIREEVGDENFFLFGLTTDEVKKRKDQGYRPWEIYESDPRLKACIDMIKSGAFSKGDKELFKPLIDHLMGHDTYMLFADFASYIAMQDQVDKVYKDTKRWTKMSILNVARSGKFSSDRAIAEYAKEIWDVTPVPVKT